MVPLGLCTSMQWHLNIQTDKYHPKSRFLGLGSPKRNISTDKLNWKTLIKTYFLYILCTGREIKKETIFHYYLQSASCKTSYPDFLTDSDTRQQDANMTIIGTLPEFEFVPKSTCAVDGIYYQRIRKQRSLVPWFSKNSFIF